MHSVTLRRIQGGSHGCTARTAWRSAANLWSRVRRPQCLAELLLLPLLPPPQGDVVEIVIQNMPANALNGDYRPGVGAN
jgi:hypothetical protein